jgi:hypothetical protein
MNVIQLLLRGGKRFTRFYLLLQVTVCVGIALTLDIGAYAAGKAGNADLLGWLLSIVFYGALMVPVTCVPVLVTAIVLALAFGS